MIKMIALFDACFGMLNIFMGAFCPRNVGCAMLVCLWFRLGKGVWASYGVCVGGGLSSCAFLALNILACWSRLLLVSFYLHLYWFLVY